jgi:hypothetical protein
MSAERADPEQSTRAIALAPGQSYVADAPVRAVRGRRQIRWRAGRRAKAAPRRHMSNATDGDVPHPWVCRAEWALAFASASESIALGTSLRLSATKHGSALGPGGGSHANPGAGRVRRQIRDPSRRLPAPHSAKTIASAFGCVAARVRDDQRLLGRWLRGIRPGSTGLYCWSHEVVSDVRLGRAEGFDAHYRLARRI